VEALSATPPAAKRIGDGYVEKNQSPPVLAEKRVKKSDTVRDRVRVRSRVRVRVRIRVRVRVRIRVRIRFRILNFLLPTHSIPNHNHYLRL
jgi:hypothetical protein